MHPDTKASLTPFTKLAHPRTVCQDICGGTPPREAVPSQSTSANPAGTGRLGLGFDDDDGSVCEERDDLQAQGTDPWLRPPEEEDGLLGLMQPVEDDHQFDGFPFWDVPSGMTSGYGHNELVHRSAQGGD